MKTRTTYRFLAAACMSAGALVAFSPEAGAVDWVIKSPSQHPQYRAELEPHANLIAYRYRGYGRGRNYRTFGDPEFGAGFRASIELGDPLFIPKLNNTIAISFGLDVTNCHYCGVRDNYSIWSPVALQWNFFLTRRWSVFAEFGGIIRSAGFYRDVWLDPAIWIGGRFHFNDKVALTMRAGVPFFSLGVSFFVGS
jgi:hypothetical protein